MFARNRRLRRLLLRNHWLCAGAMAIAAILTQTAGRVSAAEAVQVKSPESIPGDEFQAKVAPFAAKYCADCHSGDEAEAGIKLTSYGAMAEFLKARKVWRLAGQKIPRWRNAAGGPRHAAKTRGSGRRSAEWIEAGTGQKSVGGTDQSRPRDDPPPQSRGIQQHDPRPGRRRLQAGRRFSAATTSATASTTSATCSAMPSILLEKYLAAAETIVERAIVVDDPDKAPTRRILGARLEGAGSPVEEDARTYLRGRGVRIASMYRSDGEYLLTVQASADQAGREAAKMAVQARRQGVSHNSRWPTIGTTRLDTRRRFRAERGDKKVSVAFLNDFFKNEGRRSRRARSRAIAICMCSTSRCRDRWGSTPTRCRNRTSGS